MQEIVIALLLIVNGEIKEHRIQDSMSDCLKGKRVASRGTSKNIQMEHTNDRSCYSAFINS